MIKKFFKDTMIYALVPQIPKLVSVILMPIFTKYLTSIDYGIYGVLLAYTGFIAFFKDLGLYNSFFTAFFLKKTRYKLIWRQYFGILTIWSLIYGVILTITTYFVLRFIGYNDIFLALTFALLPTILFDNITMIGNIYYRVKEEPMKVALISLVGSIVMVFFNYYFIVVLNLGFKSWIYSNVIVSLVTSLIFVFPIILQEKIIPIFRIKKKWLIGTLKISLPFIPHNYSSYLINNSDRLLLSFYKINIASIGIYNLSYVFSGYFGILDNAIGMAAYPTYLKNYQEKRYKLNFYLLVILQILILISTILGSIWIKELTNMMVSNIELKDCYQYSIFLIMAYNYRPMYMASTFHLFAEEKSSMIMKISFVAGLINVGLNLIAIPFLGIKGAAIITFISFMYLGFSGFYLKGNQVNVNYFHRIWLLLIILFTFFIYLIRSISVLNKLMLSVGVIVFGSIVLFIFLRKFRLFINQN